MFQFTSSHLIKLCIHLMMHGYLLHMRVPPFGNPRVDGYMLLTVAYRSLSRPSSSTDAKAFALRS